MYSRRLLQSDADDWVGTSAISESPDLKVDFPLLLTRSRGLKVIFPYPEILTLVSPLVHIRLKFPRAMIFEVEYACGLFLCGVHSLP